MSDSSFTGFNMDSYLHLLKPKPVVPLTCQQIYDKVVIQMVRQKLPCIRMDYTDEGPVCYPTKFNSSGARSPLLSILAHEDIRILRKAVGYDFLQKEISVRNLLWAYEKDRVTASKYALGVWSSLSPTVQEKTLVVKAMLESRGVTTHELMDFLDNLEGAHLYWYDRLYPCDFTSQTSHADMEDLEGKMVECFSDFHDSHKVSTQAVRNLCP